MMEKKKNRHNKGAWVSSRRCFNCNSITLLKKYENDRKKYEDKGMTLEDGNLMRCVMMCDKGWFYSTGTIST